MYAVAVNSTTPCDRVVTVEDRVDDHQPKPGIVNTCSVSRRRQQRANSSAPNVMTGISAAQSVFSTTTRVQTLGAGGADVVELRTCSTALRVCPSVRPHRVAEQAERRHDIAAGSLEVLE
jgi:hypothetical protein